MKINKFSIASFRGLSSLNVETKGQPVLITGDNGVGKTSAILGLQLTLAGRKLHAKTAKNLSHGGIKDGYMVAVYFENDTVWTNTAGIAGGDGDFDDDIAVGLQKSPP